MTSEILEWIHQRLSVDEEVIVPLKKLWRDWRFFHDEPTYPVFAEAVLRDDRFEEMYCVDQNAEVEAFGFFPGPRIRLRTREITGFCILNLVRAYHDQVAKTLVLASELLEEDPESDSAKALVEAISMCEELKPALNPWTHLRSHPGSERGTKRNRRSGIA